MKQDLTNQRFGRLTVLGRTNGKSPHPYQWICLCDCGKVCYNKTDALVKNKVISCGCFHNEQFADRQRTHGATVGEKQERLYNIWRSMRQRCDNPNQQSYKNYGGRGIKVCAEWNDYAKFKEWAMSAGYDPNAETGKCTIDRIDNDGNYEPSNCRWVTTQAQNFNRRANVNLTFNGKTQTVSEWARELNVPVDRLRGRIRRGWKEEDVLTKGFMKGKSYVK